MGYYVKAYVACVDCGHKTNHRLAKKRIAVCVDCGIERMRVSAVQQHNKTGDGYDRWLAAMSRYVATLPIPPIE